MINPPSINIKISHKNACVLAAVNTSGKVIPKTMIVIIIANTPSLNASNLPFDNVWPLLSCLVFYDMG